MAKTSRSGGKFTGNHTSIIESASKCMDAISKCPNVTKITPGIITSGLKPLRGGAGRIKVRKETRAIHLSLRGNISQQNFYIYSTDMNASIETIRAFANKNKIELIVEDWSKK